MEKKIPPLASKWLENLLVPIDSIKPHPDNYKEHPEDQLYSLNASLSAFGWTKPICADLDNRIVAGHGMYYMALKMGYTCVPVEHLTLDQIQSKAYLAADNEIERRGITNQNKLQSIISSVLDSDIDIEALGFSEDEAEMLVNIDENFSFENSYQPSQEPISNNSSTEPSDYKNVEGTDVGVSYAIHISFRDKIPAENFLSKIGAKTQIFKEGKKTTVVDGDELEF